MAQWRDMLGEFSDRSWEGLHSGIDRGTILRSRRVTPFDFTVTTTLRRGIHILPLGRQEWALSFTSQSHTQIHPSSAKLLEKFSEILGLGLGVTQSCLHSRNGECIIASILLINFKEWTLSFTSQSHT